MIELDQLTKTFTQKDGQSVRAVDSVSLSVAEGEICVFLGPSGCGKTTTLKMINRLIQPTSGRVLINGEDTTSLNEVDLRRHIGYVIQQIGLFPNMTIEENITVVPRLLGWDKKRCAERAAELMSMVALDPKLYLKRYPRELSGGQQQRIGVIRALAADPPVLLMDEPFGAVDPINRESIQNEFFQMQRQLKKTVIMVSHDIDEAIKLGDRIAVFRRGKLVQYDHPDTLLARPKDDFVAQFVGQDSTLKRLLLVKAGDAATQPETARPDTPLSQAFATMDESDSRYLTVLDGEKHALGFVARRAARGAQGVCAERITPFPATVGVDDHLRVVLSKMYQFRASWMPVLDADGAYVGEITQDSIADYLSSGRSRMQTGQPPSAIASHPANPASAHA
ncbi:ABC transporter ATP-binding protein [Paraburkholderia sp. J41]|uniref:osmoprotectant ABC transporter ATP-binding protein OsmV n=1 Tax=Paraburkholderia sp. J41 TaxID=2805433 RepID=UPI002AC3345F|nr:ABC transporter ATP-binding protein [Paraburkholderia sp. J41]